MPHNVVARRGNRHANRNTRRNWSSKAILATKVAHGAFQIGKRAYGAYKGAKKLFGNKKRRMGKGPHRSSFTGSENGGNFSRFTVKRKIKRWDARIVNWVAKPQYVSDFAGLTPFRATSGRQGYGHVMYNEGNVQDIMMDAFWNKTGGHDQSTNRASSSIFLKSVTGSLTITNAHGTGCQVTIYDIVCRRDQPYFSAGSAYNPISPSQAYQGIVAEGTDITIDIGTTPFQSVKFCQFFKIIKKTRFILPQGVTRKHFLNFQLNTMISGSDSAQFLYRKGKTFGTFIVMQGLQAVQGTGAETNVVTIGSSHINVLKELHWTFKYLKPLDVGTYTATAQLAVLETSERGYQETFGGVVDPNDQTALEDIARDE